MDSQGKKIQIRKKLQSYMNHRSSGYAGSNTGNVVRLSTLSIKSVRGWLEKMFWKMTRIINWWKTVLFVCVLALAVDPLFFFIPVIDSHKFCFTLDKKLGVAVCVLRTLIDVFYVIHFIFHFKKKTYKASAPLSQ